MKNIYLLFLILSVISVSCSNNDKKSDAYGNFEATEIIVSAEASGKLTEFNVEEGKTINAEEITGCIDTSQFHLKIMHLEAQRNTIRTKYKNIFSQAEVLREQKEVALIEKKRIENLLKDNAATQKQLDDVNGNINVLDKQINSVITQNSTVFKESESIDVQILQIRDQIEKSIIKNPVKGTVILKLAEEKEIVNYGRPLYKIADLSEMTLRVYVSGEQLGNIKIGQTVKVLIDSTKTENKTLEGTISWISSKSEFTPKIIQTKDERVNMVYAVKVRVKNDGSLKIGMPGEIIF